MEEDDQQKVPEQPQLQLTECGDEEAFYDAFFAIFELRGYDRSAAVTHFLSRKEAWVKEAATAVIAGIAGVSQ